MSVELSLLRALRHRENYDRLHSLVPFEYIDERTSNIVRAFGEYYRETDAAEIEADAFGVWFTTFKYKNLKEESKAVYRRLFREMMTPEPEGVQRMLKERLIATKYAGELTSLLQKWDAGDEVDLYLQMRGMVEKFEQDVDRKVVIPWVNVPIEDILSEEENDSGLHFRLSEINMAIRGLRPGDFIIWAGRPDKGKTSSILSELTFMVPQLDNFPEYWAKGEANGIWFNNEGPGKRIVSRAYQAALNMTIPEMVEASRAKNLREQYAEVMGGGDRLRIMDIHGMWHYEVEDILKQVTPGIVVFDMIDNIKFGGEVANGGQRTDQLLETMYQWARVLGVKYNCIVIATSQISQEGDGLPYPTQSMLKDSKTGKQGAADLILMLGSSNEPLMASTRWISFPKNKLRRPGTQDLRLEVHFDRDRSRLVLNPR